MDFKQNNRIIFMYHIISPVALIFLVLILIFSKNNLIYALILILFNMILNFNNILTTYNTVSLTENTIHIKFLFFKKRSQSIKLSNILRVYADKDAPIVGMQPFMRIEIRYRKDKEIKERCIYKGHMSYEDFNKLSSMLMKYSVTTRKQ